MTRFDLFAPEHQLHAVHPRCVVYVCRLDLSATACTSGCLAVLKLLPRLEELNLSRTALSGTVRPRDAA